jgi:subtilisin-like proprotein convertase family protein
VSGGYSIGDLNINVAITHTWVQDLTITLEGPASLGSPVIVLQQEACAGEDNIDCTYDDAGTVPTCVGTPAISGNIAPVNSLSALNNMIADGVWILRVDDPYNEDGGAITNFNINICRVQAASVLDVTDNPLLNTKVYPNPTSGLINIVLPSLTEKTTIRVYDLQGRMVYTQETNQVENAIGLEGIQDGIYLVQIDNTAGSITKKIVLKRN